jgi:primosomal protein N' (replication factor Y)
MPYVETVVNAPGARDSTFVYSTEPGQVVGVGSLVLVPFASNRAQAIVIASPEQPPDVPIKPIAEVLDSDPVVSPAHIALARWISEHYLCSLIDALLPMLPPGVARRPRTTVSLLPGAELPSDLSEAEFIVREALRASRSLPLEQVRALLGSRRMARQTDLVIRRLAERGVVKVETAIRRATVQPRAEWFVRLAVSLEEADDARATLGRARRLGVLLDRLVATGPGKDVGLSTLREEGIGDLPLARALAERGLAELQLREVRRDPLAFRTFPRLAVPALTRAQDDAWAEIGAALDEPGYHPFLLHGITGSGKTEIYLRTIAGLLERGKRAIVLVPEISLTPQTIQRFAGRFPGRIAVLHSRLTAGERFDEWRRIRSGLADVVVGSRSAIFAPVPNLGGIVVDEEHEWSYKHERTPRYHARAAALKLGEIAGLTVVLGSATPALESYYAAQRGAMRLLTLPERVEAARALVVVGAPSPTRSDARPRLDNTGLPPVELVDLRNELREGNRSIFSTRLREAVQNALSLREQSILFLNRRGDSTFVLCRDCGFVMRCARCDASLVYHSDADDLVCHLCDARLPMPRACPACGGVHIRYFGAGTQKLESETRRLFPEARVLRWDRDAARARGAHEEILRAFTNHEADILVGTQMIAKGLDLPLVTLVGVLSADMSLHLPDFRAAERTFQLLTQVAGRAGRGPLGGRVIVQAYTPDHYCVRAAQNHDYVGFYEQEIAFRREHGYPPFGDMVRLLRVGYGEARVERDARSVVAQIRYLIRRDALDGVDVVGPAPAYHQKIRGRYRWQIVLRGRRLKELVSSLDVHPDWVVDVDPVSTL